MPTMKIEKNSRQVPKVKEITAEKYYSDVLYSHLQVISERVADQPERFVPAARINYSTLGKELGISRQTIARRFTKLIELNLIYKQENGDYILAPLPRDTAFLIPHETLRRLVNALSDNAINVYIYLINRYFANEGQPFTFSITGLKDFCGLSTKVSTNNYIITDILEILKKLNLIDYKHETKRDEKGQYHTTYNLLSAQTTL